jgi:hypothetical protein
MKNKKRLFEQYFSYPYKFSLFAAVKLTVVRLWKGIVHCRCFPFSTNVYKPDFLPYTLRFTLWVNCVLQ